MDDDRTVLPPRRTDRERLDDDRTALAPAETLNVRVLDALRNTTATFILSDDFTAGREAENTISIQHPLISRHHLAVKKENGNWYLFNLKSKNGVFVRGQLILHKAQLDLPALISLGTSGIHLEITKSALEAQTAEREIPQPDIPSLEPASNQDVVHTKSDQHRTHEQIRSRLLAENEVEDAGDYTRFVRKLIREDRSKRGRSYKKVISVLAALSMLGAGLVTYQQFALSNARALAISMFYDIKTLEVSLSQADVRLEESAIILESTLRTIASEKLRVDQERIRIEQEKIAAEKERLMQEREKLKAMKARYYGYVKEVNVLRLRFPTAAQYEENLIDKVARSLGESELEVPTGFMGEVKRYINYWQNSSRLQRAMDKLESNNYTAVVFSALEREGLPPHFIYLPLQESNYDNRAIGPETRYGIAKGAWQLLATTAQEYGLTTGPLAGTREFDDQDARFDFKRATQAGTKYLKRIYSTEAQASGLLVMASYNYGHNRVRAMIRQMPDNPRDRNFWNFIQQYKIPKETYDYVFYIFSAAVIGEDPRHFGFRFRPPLPSAN